MAKRSLGYPGGPDDGVTRVLITRRHRGICPQTRRRRREERRFENARGFHTQLDEGPETP